MKRTIYWITAVLVIAGAGFGYLIAHQQAEFKAERSAAEKDAQNRILDLQGQLTAAKTAKAQSDKKLAQLTQAASALSGNNGSRTGGAGNSIRIGDILKQHPEYAALYEKIMRRNVMRMYGPALSSLNLPPDQLSKLKDLLVERQMGYVDAQEAAEDAGLQQGTPEWRQAMQQSTQDLDPQFAAILGSNSTSILAQLQAKVSIQNQVQNTYAPDFLDAGIPLSPEQNTGLVQAMADANYAGKDLSTRPADYNTVNPSTGLSPHDTRIISGAAAVLSPAQVQVLQATQISNEQQAAIMRQYSASGVSVRP